MGVIFKIIELTPIGAKIEASQEIVKFIANIADGEKMGLVDIMDVACAVNEIIPSSSELVSFFTKSKSVRKGLIDAAKKQAKKGVKFNVKGKNIDLKAVKKVAKATAKSEFKK